MSDEPAASDDNGLSTLRAAQWARWRQGDWLVERLAGLSAKEAREVKAAAARVSATDLSDYTRMVAVARAFPVEHRRLALSFDHHEAVLKLAADADRDTVLAEAEANGWTAKQTRAAVLRLRVANGEYMPPEDDDPEDALYRAAVQACNRATPDVRRMLVESLEEANFGVIRL